MKKLVQLELDEEGKKMRRLTLIQANEIEDEIRRLEADPTVDKHEIRLFMQTPMPCGHAAGNLLTCDDPPYGCVICGEPKEEKRED